MKLNRRLVLTLVASATLLTGAAMAQQRVFFGIATGGTGGTYYPLGGMLAQLISNKAIVDGKKHAYPVATGCCENCVPTASTIDSKPPACVN